MKRFCGLFFIAAFLFITSFAFAIDEDIPQLKTTVNRHRIFVGDRIRYNAEIFSRLDLEIEFPKFKDNKTGEFDIKDFGKDIRRPLFGGRTDYVNWFDMTSYHVGKRSIPQLEIRYREKGEGNWKKLKTEKIDITVESVLPVNMRLYDIKDIKGPLYPFSLLKLLMWAAAALFIVWVLIMLINKFRKRTPPKLPHELALEELEAARAEFSKTGDAKFYYVRISDAVRRYIEAVFKLKAPEMTTQEFLMTISGSLKLSDTYKDLLKGFMEACDLVKFAKHSPSKDEIESVLTTAKKFVEETLSEYVPV